MIKRIVKLTFRPESVEEFTAIFDAYGAQIRNFPGCHNLELWRCAAPKENVFFTYSYWDDEAALDRYRHSALFEETWEKARQLFATRAEAWNVEVITKVEKLKS